MKTKRNNHSSKSEKKNIFTKILHCLIGSVNNITSKTSIVKDAENLGIKKENKNNKILAKVCSR